MLRNITLEDIAKHHPRLTDEQCVQMIRTVQQAEDHENELNTLLYHYPHIGYVLYLSQGKAPEDILVEAKQHLLN